jgi:hypothetical protein
MPLSTQSCAGAGRSRIFRVGHAFDNEEDPPLARKNHAKAEATSSLRASDPE